MYYAMVCKCCQSCANDHVHLSYLCDVNKSNLFSCVFVLNPSPLVYILPCRFQFYSISVSMHLLQSVLHVVTVGYGYILMLIIMTFNGWLFLSVCFGAGVGYLIFAKSRHLTGHFTDTNEQLQ